MKNMEVDRDTQIFMLKERVAQLEKVINTALRTPMSYETWCALYVPPAPKPSDNCYVEAAESPWDKIVDLEHQLERERNRVVYCGMVAMSDTPSSAKDLREGTIPEYKTASSSDVERMVDKLMALRDGYR
jgi:uncharacterized membrane protein